jgi:hypothetical protein
MDVLGARLEARRVVIAVITYLWGHAYRPAHVQRLARSVAQWLPVPHRFVCITDRTIPGVETMRDPASRYAARCYRRLWLFSEPARMLGDGLLHLDLDLVICGSLEPFVSRDVDFAIYRAGSIAKRGYSLNPSVFWLRPGTQTDIWERYHAHPTRLAMKANAAGFWGSDQAVISYLRMDPEPPTFGDADGLVSYRRIRSEGLREPPAGTRIVSFHGKRTPFEAEIQRLHPWIRQVWSEAA